MNRLSLLLIVPFFALLFLIPAPASVDAEVVRLRTGVNVKGKARSDLSDTDALVFEDILTGALRTFDWDVVDPVDRKRIWIDWGWEDASRRTVDGHRIRRRQATGEKVDILGLALSKDGDPIRIMRGGREIDIPAKDVVSILDEKMDPRDIWSPEQMYEQAQQRLVKEKNADLENLTSDQHWILAEFADWIEMLDKAKEHFESCANDPNFGRNNIAKQRLERVEALLRDKAALDQLREIRMAIGLKSFRRARTLLDSFEAEHKEASDAVGRRFEKAKKYFEDSRNAYFQNEARARFIREVKYLLNKKVREKDITYSDAFAFTRRDLAEQAFGRLQEHLNSRDDVTVEQAKAFWDARPKKNWWSASFGGGTFIARPPKMKKVNKKRGARKKSSGGNTGATPKTPPKPTRDSWWAKAKAKSRENHMLARFAAESALFDVSKIEYPSVCQTCNGRGVEQKTLSNGQMWTYTCTRCAGAMNDIKIKFR